LKFVMEADPKSAYSDIPDWAHEWAKETHKPVFISPMNIYNSEPQKAKDSRMNSNERDLATRSYVDEVISFWEPGLLNMKENQLNHEYTAKFCVKHGYTFNMQLHLFASLA
jgi:7-carboxy-7-deazaguanine synthase